jgi:replicative DNA helicase
VTISPFGATPTAEDVAVEAQTLGALLLGYPDVTPQILAAVTERDFTVGAHRTILEAARRIAETGRPTDAPAVLDELERSGHLAHVGGAARLSALIAEAGFAANGPHHAAQVAERARRRLVAHHATLLAANALDRDSDLDAEVATGVEAIITARREGSSGLIHAKDIADQILDSTEPADRGRSTGWRNVDRLYRPVDGQMTILSGIPGHGKTLWLDALLTNLAQLDLNARFALWSPEAAPTSEHARRLISVAQKRPWSALSAPERSAGLDWVHETFVWVDHEIHDTIGAILAQVAAAHDRQPLTGFVIDPWTELDATRDTRQREDEWISRHITRVRKFARAHSLHVWVVVHPRNLERRSDGTFPVPSASDLHSGSVWRKKADMLVCVWRDEAGCTRPPTTVDVHVQKVRNDCDGRIGRTELTFDPVSRRYHPIARAVETM